MITLTEYSLGLLPKSTVHHHRPPNHHCRQKIQYFAAEDTDKNTAQNSTQHAISSEKFNFFQTSPPVVRGTLSTHTTSAPHQAFRIRTCVPQNSSQIYVSAHVKLFLIMGESAGQQHPELVAKPLMGTKYPHDASSMMARHRWIQPITSEGPTLFLCSTSFFHLHHQSSFLPPVHVCTASSGERYPAGPGETVRHSPSDISPPDIPP